MKAIITPQSYFGSWLNFGPLEYDKKGAFRYMKFPIGICAALNKNVVFKLYCDSIKCKIPEAAKKGNGYTIYTSKYEDFLIIEITADSEVAALLVDNESFGQIDDQLKLRKIEIEYE